MIKLGNFTEAELACNCCGVNKVDDKTARKLQRVRDILGEVMNINSAYRCVKHNKEIGGSPTSSHLKGKAIDITCKDAPYRYRLLKAILEVFDRVLIYETFIHIDSDEDKPKGIVTYMK